MTVEQTEQRLKLQKQLLIEQRITNQGKSILVAYILWFFLGSFGAHRFYLNKIGTAVTMLVISLISIPLCYILIGFVGVLIISIWWIIDAFLIPAIVADSNDKLRFRLNHELFL